MTGCPDLGVNHKQDNDIGLDYSPLIDDKDWDNSWLMLATLFEWLVTNYCEKLKRKYEHYNKILYNIRLNLLLWQYIMERIDLYPFYFHYIFYIG